MEQYLEIARLSAPHGIRGECRAELLCDSAEAIRNVRRVRLSSPDGKELTVDGMRRHRDGVLFHFAGITTPEEVGLLRGTILFADRAEITLGADRVFIRDILGAPVTDCETGQTLGVLREVLEYPANQVYVIRTPDGKDVLFPAVPAFIESAAPDGIRIRVIPGFFGGRDDAV